jgi:membrane associated rhomboid family serine protease
VERLLARLERKLGRFAIPNLTLWICGGMAFVYLLLYAKPELRDSLELHPWLALRQPWRFVTFLFLPSGSLIRVFFQIYWMWFVGQNLESEWGSFKFNVYYLIGTLGTIAVAYLTGMPQGMVWLNASLLFAFATLFPDYEIRLYLLIPIPMKWLAIPTALIFGWYFFDGDNGTRAAIAVGISNYFIFFAGHLLAIARGQQLQMKQAARRAGLRSPPRETENKKADGRACAICGKSQDDGADIRVCSCEKCGGPRELCLEHARNH